MPRTALSVLIVLTLFTGGCQTTKSKLDLLDSELYFDFSPGFIKERQVIRTAETRSEFYYFQGGYVRLTTPNRGGKFAPWSNVTSVLAESTSALSGIPADKDEVVEETIGAEHRFILTQESDEAVAFGFMILEKFTQDANWAWEPWFIEGVIRARRNEMTPEEITAVGRHLMGGIYRSRYTWARDEADAPITLLWGGVSGFFTGRITSSLTFEDTGSIEVVHSSSGMKCTGKYYGEILMTASGNAPWVLRCPDGKAAKGWVENPLQVGAHGNGTDLEGRELLISFSFDVP